jgi:cold shock CspA family protein
VASVPPRKGTVAEFDDYIGLGIVRGDEGGEWPFHCTQIADGSRSINVGAPVVFDVAPGGPGRWEAINVLPVGPPAG